LLDLFSTTNLLLLTQNHRSYSM